MLSLLKKVFIQPILDSKLSEIEPMCLHFIACLIMGMVFSEQPTVPWLLNLIFFVFNFWDKNNLPATLFTSLSLLLFFGLWW